MRNLKRVLTLAAVASASVLAFAVPAHADGGKASCTIEGTAEADVPILFGGGTYEFDEFFAWCEVTTKNKAGWALVTLDIDSAGTFTNLVCGTGEAGDDDPSVDAQVVIGDPSADEKVEAADWGYEITFVGGHGTLVFTGWGTTGGGAVHISPDPNQPAQGDDCVGGFTVVADVAATF